MSFDEADIARRFLPSLRQSETLPPAHWHAYQMPQLERLCRHAATQTQFYQDRLAMLFEDGDARSGRFISDAWRRVPILTRNEARDAGEELFAKNVPPDFGGSVNMETSGSTGRPLRFRKSALANAAAMAMFERMLEWHAIDRSAGLALIRPDLSLEDGPRTRLGWNLTVPDATRFEFSKAASSREHFDWLLSVEPNVLMTIPSVVEAIVHEAERTGRRPVGLSFVLVTSETVPEGLRERVTDRLGAKLVDAYGTREVGQIAIECPALPMAKHTSGEIMFTEVLRDDGSAAAPGEFGRIVVTPFFNFATPLVRYDVGDIVVQGHTSCSCGRTLPTLGEILGRRNSLWRSRDGTRRWPKGLRKLYDVLCAKQMQFVQMDFEKIEVRYAPDHAKGPANLDLATRILQERIHPELCVTFSTCDEIARGRGGKYEWFVSNMPDA